MPILTCRCPNGHQWDDLISNTILEAMKAPLCPTCQLPGEVVPCGTAIQTKGYPFPDPNHLDTPEQRLEYQAAMEHRAWLENNVEARDRETISVVEHGPNHFRPFGNAERPRKYY